MRLDIRKLGTALTVLTVSAVLTSLSAAQSEEVLYKSKCAVCHAADGSGKTAVGQKLGTTNLRAPGALGNAPNWFEIIKNGKGKMPSYGAKLTDVEINDLVKFIRELASTEGRGAQQATPQQSSVSFGIHIVGSSIPPDDIKQVETACGGPVLIGGREQNLAGGVFEQLTRNLTLGTSPGGEIQIYPTAPPGTAQEKVFFAVISSDQINAWTIPSTKERGGGIICFPTGMIRFLADAPSEVAAVIAHEMGHAIDNSCRTPPGYKHTPTEQRVCESKADTIGFAIMVAAGHSPFAMAGAFGRLEMFSGDTQTGLFARLKGLLENHPITPDRIQRLHNLIINFCAKNPGRCG
jgi:cytochrome c6